MKVRMYIPFTSLHLHFKALRSIIGFSAKGIKLLLLLFILNSIDKTPATTQTVTSFKTDTPVRRTSVIGWFWPNFTGSSVLNSL